MGIEAQDFWSVDRDARSTLRRSLRLDVQGSCSRNGDVHATVHNMSTTGVLIQTDADLAIGEVVNVDIPDVQALSARVMWADQGFYGCSFGAPVSAAIVSATLLRAPFDQAARIIGPYESKRTREDLDRRSSGKVPSRETISDRAKAWVIVSSAVAAWILAGIIASPFVYWLS